MYVLLSLSFLLDNDKKLFKRTRLQFFILITQVFAIVLFGSRIGYIILVMLLFLYTYKNLKFKSKKEKVKLGLTYLVVIIILLIASWNIPIVKERILFTFGYQQNYKFNNQETIKNNTPEEQGRLLLWKDTFELIKKKPLFGYGTGSNNMILYQKYKEKEHSLFLEKRYNAHNTYLEVLLTGGITLLLTYLIVLGVLLYQGITRKNFVMISFFLVISITGLTETIFRAQGIVFFAFFYCFLLSTKNNE
jgi:O-antigen ligase